MTTCSTAPSSYKTKLGYHSTFLWLLQLPLPILGFCKVYYIWRLPPCTWPSPGLQWWDCWWNECRHQWEWTEKIRWMLPTGSSALTGSGSSVGGKSGFPRPSFYRLLLSPATPAPIRVRYLKISSALNSAHWVSKNMCAFITALMSPLEQLWNQKNSLTDSYFKKLTHELNHFLNSLVCVKTSW